MKQRLARAKYILEAIIRARALNHQTYPRAIVSNIWATARDLFLKSHFCGSRNASGVCPVRGPTSHVDSVRVVDITAETRKPPPFTVSARNAFLRSSKSIRRKSTSGRLTNCGFLTSCLSTVVNYMRSRCRAQSRITVRMRTPNRIKSGVDLRPPLYWQATFSRKHFVTRFRLSGAGHHPGRRPQRAIVAPQKLIPR